MPEKTSASSAESPVHEDFEYDDEVVLPPAVASPEAAAEPATHQTAPILSWIESQGTGTENDTMLRFTPSQHNAIDLTEANASGLMQLFGGRRTRLSTLLNDASVLEPGLKRPQYPQQDPGAV